MVTDEKRSYLTRGSTRRLSNSGREVTVSNLPSFRYYSIKILALAVWIMR